MVCVVILTGVAAWNYLSAWAPAHRAIDQDPRNAKVVIWPYHRYGIAPGELVMDLRSVDPEAAPLDVIRVLLHAASGLKQRRFDRVVLSYRGAPKLMLKGDFFKTLGEEYGQQNVAYTLRTLPENVYRLGGEQAYGTWTGGVLGVLGKQMQDLGKLSEDWYLQDMATSHR